MGMRRDPDERGGRRSLIGGGISGGIMAALVGLGIVVVLMAFDILPTFGTKTVNRSQTPVLQEIQLPEKFKAATGVYQVVVDLEKDVDGVPSVIAGERTVMVAAGTVDAEVDFSGLKSSAIVISQDRKSVRIVVPPPALTDADLDSDKTYVVARNRGILDRIGDALSDNPVDDQALYQLADEKLAEAAKESGLAETARSNTQNMLYSMLRSLGFETVEIVFDKNAPTQAPGVPNTVAVPLPTGAPADGPAPSAPAP